MDDQPQNTRGQKRDWCFTLNDPQDLLNPEQWPDCEYCLYQLELGEETGMPHLQGFVKFRVAKRMATVKEQVPELQRAHLEGRRGTIRQAIDYCRKNDTRLEGPWEFGEEPAGDLELPVFRFFNMALEFRIQSDNAAAEDRTWWITRMGVEPE